jgi:hypothetical protein
VTHGAVKSGRLFLIGSAILLAERKLLIASGRSRWWKNEVCSMGWGRWRREKVETEPALFWRLAKFRWGGDKRAKKKKNRCGESSGWVSVVWWEHELVGQTQNQHRFLDRTDKTQLHC